MRAPHYAVTTNSSSTRYVSGCARRINLIACPQDIRDLFSSWSSELDSCCRIWMHAPGAINRQIRQCYHRYQVITGRSLIHHIQEHCSRRSLHSSQPVQVSLQVASLRIYLTLFRVRSVPLQVRRPTHQETIRVHTALTQLVPHVNHLLAEAPTLTERDSESTCPDPSPDNCFFEQLKHQLPASLEVCESKPVEVDQQLVDADEDDEHWKSLVIACQKSQLPRLKTAVLQRDPTLHCIRSDGCTLLHIAASAGSWRVVDLLIEAGVSPIPRDRRRKSAYDVSKDKETRDSFRRGM